MTCLGYYYCPLLPFITSIILFITFYLQYFLSLNINFKSSNKTWTDSKTRTLYLIISFAAILISFIFYFMTVTVTEVKDVDGVWCGPFPAGDTPVSHSGIISEDADVTYWIFNATIWASITGTKIYELIDIDDVVSVGSIVISYYLWTMVSSQKSLKISLIKELEKSKKELRELLSKEEIRRKYRD